MVGPTTGVSGSSGAERSTLSEDAIRSRVRITVELPDHSRRTLTGSDLAQFLDNGARIQSELGYNPQDFQALVRAAIDNRKHNVTLTRDAQNAFMFDGVDNNATPAGIVAILDANPPRPSSGAGGMRAPSSGGAGIRTGAHFQQRSTDRRTTERPDLHRARTLMVPSDDNADMRRMATVLLLQGGPSLRAAIAPPVPEAQAKERLRTFLAETAPDGATVGDIRNFANLIYEQSRWITNPATTGETREQLLAEFLAGMPEDRRTLGVAADLLSHPVLQVVSAERLRVRLDAIAANGYREEDLLAFKEHLDRRAERMGITLPTPEAPPPAAPITVIVSAVDRTLNDAIVDGGTRANFALIVSNAPVEDRAGLTERLESNDDRYVVEFMEHMPASEEAQRIYVHAASRHDVRPEDLARLAEQSERLAESGIFDTLFDSFILALPMVSDDFETARAAAVRAEESKKRAQKLAERARADAAVDQQANMAASDHQADLATLQSVIERIHARDPAPPPRKN